VRQESPKKPWKRSRLWCHEESFNVLDKNKGSGKLKGLVLDMEMLEKEDIYESFELETNALSKMDNLMLLQLNFVKFNGSYKNFPKKLRWLCMHGFSLKSLPLDLPMENMVVLDMSYSNLESFDMSDGNPQQPGKRQKLSSSCSKGKQLLRSLKILNLSFCEQLQSLGGFSEFPALERLILSNCSSLIEVCESIEQCDGLDLIDLSYCNNVGKLLKTINKVKKVKILKLDGCNLGETMIEMGDDVEETLNCNNLGMNSQTSSSTIVEAIPRAFKSYLIYLPSSLVCLQLQDCKLSNESFPKDMSSLSMLKELYLDRNFFVSLPNWVRSLSRIEILGIGENDRLESLEHPPPTLKELRFDFDRDGEATFNREMSPVLLNYRVAAHDWENIEGIHKEEDMRDVEEKMVYEFGIFGTWYMGKEMPNWISDRMWKGTSISFTIPSSPCNIRGLNLFFVLTTDRWFFMYFVSIKISNITKMCTWIYDTSEGFKGSREGITYLSHWMFGKNEMEDGDQITISLSADHDGLFRRMECGVSLVYDEDEDKDDGLGYYKSWNHIIGGDLSPFQTTTPGEYYLQRFHFFGNKSFLCDYVDEHRRFTAFRPSK
ncbi:hypothetical protein Ccrd_026352, partial [Cynara cardunculus var. scolymus]